MKKIFVSFAAVAIFFFTAIQAHAVPYLRLDPGTQSCRTFTSATLWEGYTTFRKSCKSCHSRDNDKNAPFLHTESKTMKGWTRVFFKRYPQCAKNGKWAGLDKEQVLRLNDYLYRNALDSWDPSQDCG